MSVGERVVAWSRVAASVVARALGAPFRIRQDPLTARMEVGEWDGEDSRTIQDLRPGRGWGWACRPWRVADHGGAGPGGSGSPLFPRALPEAKRAPPPHRPGDHGPASPHRSPQRRLSLQSPACALGPGRQRRCWCRPAQDPRARPPAQVLGPGFLPVPACSGGGGGGGDPPLCSCVCSRDCLKRQ